MRKIKMGYLFSALLAGLFIYTACSKQLGSNTPEQEKSIANARAGSEEGREIMLVESYVFDKKNSRFNISFMDRARTYYSPVASDAQYGELNNILRTAVKTAIPVAVTFDTKNNVFVSLSKATQEEIKSYFETHQKEKIPALAKVDTITQKQMDSLIWPLINRHRCSNGQPGVWINGVCITFEDPFDGCYARAHWMWRLLRDSLGIETGKLFLISCGDPFQIKVTDINGKTCCLSWGYHVAPEIWIRDSTGTPQRHIIDPSLFPNGPVPVDKWRDRIKDGSCGTPAPPSIDVPMPGDVYWLYRNGCNVTGVEYDPGFIDSERTLRDHRNNPGTCP